MSRRKTGLKRPFPIEVGFSRDEDEYIARMAFACDLSKASFIRERALPRAWHEDLAALRKEQKGLAGIYEPRTGVYRPDPATNGKGV